MGDWTTVHSQEVTSFAARLHHHATTDGIEGVGSETSNCSDSLSNRPADNNVCVLGIWEHTCRVNMKGSAKAGGLFTKSHTFFRKQLYRLMLGKPDNSPLAVS